MALESLTSISQSMVSMLDQLGDSILVTDVQGRIVYVNGTFERLTGYGREEVLGRTPDILKSGAHPAELFAELWSTLREGRPFRCILTNRRKNGDLYEEGMVISPLRGSGGEIEGYFSMGREIMQSRQTYDLFTLLADNSPAGVYLLQDGEFSYVNRQFTALTGYGAGEIVGKRWWHIVLPEDRDLVREAAAAMLKGGRSAPFEYRLLHKSGGVRWILESVASVRFTGPRSVSGLFTSGHFVDITDRKSSEHDLAQAASLYAATVEATADGIVVLNLYGEIVAYNRRMVELWDLPETEHGVSTEAMKATVSGHLREPKALTGIVARVIADHEIETTDELDLFDDRTIEVHTRPQFIANVAVGRVWSFRDVTERRQFEAQLLHMATHDSLTGLLNRHGFQEAIEEKLLSPAATRGALLLLDIDNFKDVNDSLGHQAGDDILVQLGFLLTESMPDHTVARFGGDEFAVYMGADTVAAARAQAARALAAISNATLKARGVSVATTASAGLAVFPDHASSVGDLFAFADLAMYEAKARGRDRLVVYSPRLHSGSKVQFRRDWQNRLQEAIRNETLKFCSQPVVDLATGGVAYHELEVRLPGYGSAVLSPRGLSGVAESSGMALALDRVLVCEASRLLRRLAAGGAAASIFVGVSRRAIHDPGFLQLAREYRRQSGEQAGSLIIGIPAEALTNLGETVRSLDALREAGCLIAIDEMRESTSFFRPIRRYPIDLFRVDPGVINGLTANELDRQMAKGMVSIAHGLNIKTVAQSVGDVATVEILRRLGFDYAQGSQFGRRRAIGSTLHRNALRRVA